MKLVLKEEVYNVGRAGDVVEVADGYGRNYLVPAGIAIPATDGAMKQAEALRRAREAEEAETFDDAQQVADQMEARTLTIPKRMDEGGRLYGSVTRADIHQILRERGHRVDERRIDLTGTLKEIGSYEIPVEVHPQVTAHVPVQIVDVEGKVTEEAEQVPVEVDEEAVSEAAAAAAEAAEESLTDAETLAEQALQAARQYEEQQKARGLSTSQTAKQASPADEETEPDESDQADTAEGAEGADDAEEADEADEADAADGADAEG